MLINRLQNMGRAPYGARGLKYDETKSEDVFGYVAPHTGRVD